MHNCKTILHRFRNSLFLTSCCAPNADRRYQMETVTFTMGLEQVFVFSKVARLGERRTESSLSPKRKEGQNGKAKARDQLDICKINWFMLRLWDGDKRIRVNKATSTFLNDGISFAVLSPSAQTHTIRKRLNLVINFFSEKTQDIAISFSSHKDEFFILLSSACHVDNPFTSPSET